MIGTTAAILGAAAIGAGGSLISGFMGSSAATQASQTQAQATDKATALQAATLEQARNDSMPWMKAGADALAQYQGELGLSKTGVGGTPFVSQFTTTPDYQFQVQEGEKGVMNNLAGLGMKNSGAALKELTKFREGLASTTRGNYLTRLSNLATGGQQQANDTNALAANTTSNIAQGGVDAATARASGYVGAANSWSNALSGVANNSSNALGWLSGNNGWAA